MVDKIKNLETEVENILKSEEIKTNDNVTIQTKLIEKLKEKETVKRANDKSYEVAPKATMTEKTEAVSNVKILKCDECCFTSTKKSLKLHKDTKNIQNRLKKNSIVFSESMDKDRILKKCEELINM